MRINYSVVAMRYQWHLEGHIALLKIIEDHTYDVSIYGSEIRRISASELPVLAMTKLRRLGLYKSDGGRFFLPHRRGRDSAGASNHGLTIYTVDCSETCDRDYPRLWNEEVPHICSGSMWGNEFHRQWHFAPQRISSYCYWELLCILS